MDWKHSLIRLGLSLLLSFPIGWNRERAHKSAGLRTHLLVSLGSCLFTWTGLETARHFGGDPARIASQVVTGIGFLGGGAILRERFAVRGITTAASIWSTAAVGMACGAGFYPAALVGAGATLLVLGLVERWEARDRRRMWRPIVLKIRVKGIKGLERVRDLATSHGVRKGNLHTEEEAEVGTRVVTIEERLRESTVSRLVTQLMEDPNVTGVESVRR